MPKDYKEMIREAAVWAEQKQRDYCLRRLVALGLPVTLIDEKRITKKDFYEDEEYFEYILDEGTPNEIFLFAERLGVKDTGQGLGFVQHLSNDRNFVVTDEKQPLWQTNRKTGI